MEVAQKPTFYSDLDFFIVTLPNRSVATPAQVSMESVASGTESAETSTVLHGMSTDAEVSELCERLNGTRLTASTKERTLELFKRYWWAGIALRFGGELHTKERRQQKRDIRQHRSAVRCPIATDFIVVRQPQVHASCISFRVYRCLPTSGSYVLYQIGF